MKWKLGLLWVIWGYIGVIWGYGKENRNYRDYRGYIGLYRDNGNDNGKSLKGLCRGYIGIIIGVTLGFKWDNGKEGGNYREYTDYDGSPLKDSNLCTAPF